MILILIIGYDGCDKRALVLSYIWLIYTRHDSYIGDMTHILSDMMDAMKRALVLSLPTTCTTLLVYALLLVLPYYW